MKLIGTQLANGNGNIDAGQYSCDILARIDGQSQFVGKLNYFTNETGLHVYRFVGANALEGELDEFTSPDPMNLHEAAETLFS